MTHEQALKTAIETAQVHTPGYVCVWRKEDGSFDYNTGDSRWACEVQADEPHFTWQPLDASEIIDDSAERAKIMAEHELDTYSDITLEHVHALLGKDEAVQREFDAATAWGDWDDFVAAIHA